MQKKFEAIKYLLKSPFLDIGKADASILLIGMGRSGTTWAANIINHKKNYRVLFEPFFPSLVHEAKQFEYIQYMAPEDSNSKLAIEAKNILAGRARSQWVDRDNSGILYRRRIIKDIRCNLMVGWLKKIAPHLPVILLIRHPLQVAVSWRRLGWGKEALGQRSDFEIITSQHRLLKDFPQIETVAKQIDPKNFIDNVIFLWGVFHLVPFTQLKQDEIYYLFYEYLLNDPEEECRKLFNYLEKTFSWKQIRKVVIRESSTNFLERDFSREKELLHDGWKNEFSAAEIERAFDILKMFGLETIYDAHGGPIGTNTSQKITHDKTN